MAFINLTGKNENLITVKVDSICTITNELIYSIPARKIADSGYTTISLINGHTITVKETVAEIEETLSEAGGLFY